MKKKIALIITIAVCIVSVSANVYQYRVIRNKDAQIVWNQTTEDQMFQGILGHIQEEILYLQTCEPDEKDFRIGDLAILAGHCNFCTALGMGEAHVILEDRPMGRKIP